ncbi:MAG: hypothetical protein IJ737_06850 [Ruminococcus sp.]|nr:hypothetical protein [Ruminococcus sp.]
MKDMEKMYREDKEKQKKNEKKKKKNHLLGIILLLIFLALLLWLLNYLGLGFGFGKGKGGDKKGDGSGAGESSTAAEVPAKTSTVTYQEITVSGDKYIINDQEKELEAVIADAQALAAEGNVEFRIIDDGALNDYLEDLTDALEEASLTYNFQQEEIDPSEADAQTESGAAESE